jgi:hypothetical protein
METTQVNSDEIDLSSLLLRYILIIRDNFWTVTLLFILGLILGTGFILLSPRQYKAEMIINSDILRDSFVEANGKILDNLIEDKNMEGLATLLGLSLDEANEIKSIIFKSSIEKWDVSKGDYFVTATVKVLNRDILPKVEKGIVSFLENNEFTKVRVAQTRSYNQRVISIVDTEIASLQNFKESLYKDGGGSFSEKNKGSFVMSPSEINNTIVTLTKEKANAEAKLENSQSIEVVQGLIKPVTPSWPKLSIALASGAGLGLALAAMALIFKSIRRMARNAGTM